MLGGIAGSGGGEVSSGSGGGGGGWGGVALAPGGRCATSSLGAEGHRREAAGEGESWARRGPP